jgi:hypothetical protein
MPKREMFGFLLRAFQDLEPTSSRRDEKQILLPRLRDQDDILRLQSSLERRCRVILSEAQRSKESAFAWGSAGLLHKGAKAIPSL